jgi:transposase-like protein
MRNVLAVVPKGTQEMVVSIIRTIFAQLDAEHVRNQFDEVASMLERSHPKVSHMLNDAKEDLLAFTGFPLKPWRQIWSTNPLERVNKEICECVCGGRGWLAVRMVPALGTDSKRDLAATCVPFA